MNRAARKPCFPCFQICNSLGLDYAAGTYAVQKVFLRWHQVYMHYVYFPNGFTKTPVEVVKQTCCEGRNYLKSAKHFYLQVETSVRLSHFLFSHSLEFLFQWHRFYLQSKSCGENEPSSRWIAKTGFYRVCFHGEQTSWELDIPLAEEKNVGIYCSHSALWLVNFAWVTPVSAV